MLNDQVDRIAAKLKQLSIQMEQRELQFINLQIENEQLLEVKTKLAHQVAQKSNGATDSETPLLVPEAQSLFLSLPTYLQLLDEQIQWLEQA